MRAKSSAYISHLDAAIKLEIFPEHQAELTLIFTAMFTKLRIL
jgi:hypothetical protein